MKGSVACGRLAMAILIITLDGPAGSGKSTVARLLAKRLGLEFLDTGAMYRGLTAYCLDHGIDPVAMPNDVVKLANDCPITFDWASDPPQLRIAGQDITSRLRDSDVTGHVSDVSSIPQVRRVLVDAQRRIAQAHPRLVTEGRDQGSVAFPNATLKFFLDAQPMVRAKRRADQLRAAGKPADEAEILEKITRRDERDANRKDGPLICPEDAQRIDTSELALDEVVTLLEDLVRHRLEGDMAEDDADTDFIWG